MWAKSLRCMAVLILVVAFLGFGRVAEAAVSDHLLSVEIGVGWDYDDPSDPGDLTYEFEFWALTDETVTGVEFLTPAGFTFQASGPYAEDGVWGWEYWVDFDDPADLADYGDGTYTVTVYYDGGGQDQTTVWFGIPGTSDPIPQPTQEPELTFPPHNGSATSPVTITWEPCVDGAATQIWLDVQHGMSGVEHEIGFPVDATSAWPLQLSTGPWEAELAFEHWYSIPDNGDGIPVEVGKYSESTYYFTVTDQLSDHLRLIEIFQYWDHGGPQGLGDLSYEFEFWALTDDTVTGIEFLTPGGFTFQASGPFIENGPSQFNGGLYEWWYHAELGDPADLADYGDGTYTVTVYYDGGGQDQTTVWFGIPGSADPIPQPIQEPVLTFPPHNGSATSPVTFAWEPCVDPAVSQIYLDLEHDTTEAEWSFAFAASATGSQPIVLSQGPWEAELSLSKEYFTWDNGDGVSVLVGKDSISDHAFWVSMLAGHGTLLVGSEWTWMSTCPYSMFSDPVVIGGPPTNAEGQPGVLRLRNVTGNGFEVRFQEWDYLDGLHAQERIHGLVVESGTWDLGGGKKLTAETFATSNTNVYSPTWIPFPEPFDDVPVVLTQVQTYNGSGAVTDRICGVTTDGFYFAMQVQEASAGHVSEVVGYVAVSEGTTEIGGYPCDVHRTAAVVTDRPFTLATRYGQCVVWAEEEQSADAETQHQAAEVVGFICFGGQPPLIARMQTCNGGDTCALRSSLLSQAYQSEHGTTEITHQWQVVNLSNSYVDPVVVAGPPTYAGTDPGVVRVRNVTSDSFEIRFQEWNYLDGGHYAPEGVHYWVMERGLWNRGGEVLLIADKLSTNNMNLSNPTRVQFLLPYEEVSMVIATQQTANGSDAITHRLSNVQPTGFSVALQEEEAGDGWHCEETVGYVTMGFFPYFSAEGVGAPVGSARVAGGPLPQKDRGRVLPVPPAGWEILVVEEQSKDVETWHCDEIIQAVYFGDTPSQRPCFVADMQTCWGRDPASLRCRRMGGVVGSAASPVEVLGTAAEDGWALAVRAEDDSGGSVAGVGIAVTRDADGGASVETPPAVVQCRPDELVTLVAPESVLDGGRLLCFDHWQVDGEPVTPHSPTVKVQMTGDREAAAMYGP